MLLGFDFTSGYALLYVLGVLVLVFTFVGQVYGFWGWLGEGCGARRDLSARHHRSGRLSRQR